MTVWRDVQEAIYARWLESWGDTSLTQLGNETFDPPDALWCQLLIQSRPSGVGTIGKPGNRKMDREGVVFVLLREPPGDGTGNLADKASAARDVFEGCRFGPHSLRFNEGDIGEAGDVDSGRWWGVAVEVPFAYEELK